MISTGSSGNGKGVPLTCSSCNLPFAYIRNGVLVIQSRHHGEPHINVIAISELMKLITASIKRDPTLPGLSFALDDVIEGS